MSYVICHNIYLNLYHYHHSYKYIKPSSYETSYNISYKRK